MRWYVIGLVVSALIGWLFAQFFWPWVGPLLLTPCPLFTRAGVIVVTVIVALLGGLPRRWVHL